MGNRSMQVRCKSTVKFISSGYFTKGKVYTLTKIDNASALVNHFVDDRGLNVRLSGKSVAEIFDVKNPVKEKVNGMNLEKMTVKELNELIENAKREIARQDMTKLEKKVRELNRVLREVNELASELETILEETLENAGDDDFGYDSDNLCFLQTVKVNINDSRYGYENYVEFE